MCCCLYSKGKNFRANHNWTSAKSYNVPAVVYIAKVRILEQITTGDELIDDNFTLLFI